jgi:D-tyrosyl-tRNA(Tyr) deacylase
VLVVSQFTLCADVSRGRRPSFDTAMEPAAAEALYQSFCHIIAGQGIKVATGVFGAKMAIELINDGPVTFVLDK